MHRRWMADGCRPMAAKVENDRAAAAAGRTSRRRARRTAAAWPGWRRTGPRRHAAPTPELCLALIVAKHGSWQPVVMAATRLCAMHLEMTEPRFESLNGNTNLLSVGGRPGKLRAPHRSSRAGQKRCSPRAAATSSSSRPTARASCPSRRPRRTSPCCRMAPRSRSCLWSPARTRPGGEAVFNPLCVFCAENHECKHTGGAWK